MRCKQIDLLDALSTLFVCYGRVVWCGVFDATKQSDQIILVVVGRRRLVVDRCLFDHLITRCGTVRYGVAVGWGYLCARRSDKKRE